MKKDISNIIIKIIRFGLLILVITMYQIIHIKCRLLNKTLKKHGKDWKLPNYIHMVFCREKERAREIEIER